MKSLKLYIRIRNSERKSEEKYLYEVRTKHFKVIKVNIKRLANLDFVYRNRQN